MSVEIANLEDVTYRLQPLEVRASIEEMARDGWTVRSILASRDAVVVTFKPPKFDCA